MQHGRHRTIAALMSTEFIECLQGHAFMLIEKASRTASLCETTVDMDLPSHQLQKGWGLATASDLVRA